MLTMWYDNIVMVIIILLSSDYIKESETHNYLVHVSLYNSFLNLDKAETKP